MFYNYYGRNNLCYLRSNRLPLCYLKCVICGAKLGHFDYNIFHRTLCYVIGTISLLKFVTKSHQKQWVWGSSTVSQTTRTRWTFSPLNQIRGEKVHMVKSIIFEPIRLEHCECRPYCLNLPFNDGGGGGLFSWSVKRGDCSHMLTAQRPRPRRLDENIGSWVFSVFLPRLYYEKKRVLYLILG